MVQPLVSLNLFKKLGENGAVLSAASSMLLQNSLLKGKITGKIIRICYYSCFKAQYLLSKADFTCKFNREFN